jgi:hypothetical protein
MFLFFLHFLILWGFYSIKIKIFSTGLILRLFQEWKERGLKENDRGGGFNKKEIRKC